MAGAAAGTATGMAIPADSRPTLEQQLEEVKKKSNKEQAQTAQQLTQARMSGNEAFTHSPLDKVSKEQASAAKEEKKAAHELGVAASVSATNNSGTHKGGVDIGRNLSTTIKNVWGSPKPILVAGAAGAGALAGFGLRGLGKVAGGTKTAVGPITGTFPILVLVFIIHIGEVYYNFPRGSAGFGAILGGYAAVLVLSMTLSHIPVKDFAPYVVAQILVPMAVQMSLTNPALSFIFPYRETIASVMILCNLCAIYLLFATDQSDTIMHWSKNFYIIFIAIMIIPIFATLFEEVVGPQQQSTVNFETVSRGLLKDWWTNAQTFGAGVINFIPNLIDQTKKDVDPEPPPGAAIGTRQVIGWEPTNEEQIFRPNTFQRTSMNLHIESGDKTTYQFENFCRCVKDRDKDDNVDADDDGFADMGSWTDKIGLSPKLASTRTFFCPIDPWSCDEEDTRDSADIQFLAKYDVKIVGSYTTYFIEESVDEFGILKTNYEGELDFFKRNFGLDQAPLSEATQSPCFMSIDTNQNRPPIGVRKDTPEWADYKVPLVIGFTAQSFYGDTIIDSIGSMDIEVPEGISDLVCEGFPGLLEKKDARTYSLKTQYGKEVHGKKIRIDCEATVDPNKLIWSGDYSQSTYRVTSVCNMLNQNKVNARLVARVGGSSGGGFSRSWSAWPKEGSIAGSDACYGYTPGLEGVRGTPWHNGVDIGGSGEVRVVEHGFVDRICAYNNRIGGKGGCDDNQGYGNIVIVKHSDNFYTFYGHLATWDVSEGDELNVGDKIGEAGDSGVSTGVHLHFGIATQDGKLTNPGKDVPEQNPICSLPESSSGGNTWKGVCPEPVGCKPRGGGVSGQEGEILSRFASELGIPDNNAKAIALTETGGEHWDENGNVKRGDGGASIGMMQIYTIAHPKCAGIIQGTSCMGAPTCDGQTLEDLTCNVEAGLMNFKSHYNAQCAGFTGWEAAAGRYNGCCASGCTTYLAEYRRNGGTT
ncbi:MAG: M23 family metallopeptidase [Nanoarchaeota archaeon]